MKKILDLITEEMEKAFGKAGYDGKYGRVTVSNRPDLCEYQCNGAMAAAKEYHKAPIMIASDVVEALADTEVLAEAQAVSPGFINLKISSSFLSGYLNDMHKEERLGYEKVKEPETIMITAGPMWRSRCMWDICVRRSSGRVSKESPGLQATR